MAEEVKQTISLLDQIKEVAQLRQRFAVAQMVKDEAFLKWKESNAGLYQEIDKTSAEVTASETLLRELTIKAYNETGNKNPAPGVGIRERIVLQYDGKVAFDWAKAHKIALMLDTKAFEKIAKADPPDFVKTITEPQATIATDLSKIIEVKEG